MVRPGRVALAGIQERGQALGVDLWQVPRRDSARSTHTLEYDTAQSRRVGFFPQLDGGAGEARVRICLVASASTSVQED
jgi:hypothetical protein